MTRPALATDRLVDELHGRGGRRVRGELVDGWLLRACTEAPFRRCNSVLPHGPSGQEDLDATLALVERFYAERGLPSRYLISPAATPTVLDDTLEARGYEIEEPVLVQLAAAATVVERTAPSALGRVRVTDDIDERWIGEYAAAHGDDVESRQRVVAYGRLLTHVAPAVGAAVLELDDGPPIALGLGVLERGWAGIYAMTTRPDLRRRGAATAVLHGLAEWALDRDADHLYLQVEAANDGARQLYVRGGFETAYRYHYRTAVDV
jgi:GNAT superfamily N-acetyltransferase